MTRLFLAIWPPDDVLDRLADMERPKDQGVKWVPQENLHITLRFLGDADEAEVADRLDEVLLPAATAVVGPAFDLLGERSLITPVPASTISRPWSSRPCAGWAPNRSVGDSRVTSRWHDSPETPARSGVPGAGSMRRST
jgi:hypothetical protein